MNMTNKIENRLLIAGSVVATLLGFWLVLRLFIVPTYTAQIEFLQKQNAAKDATITELSKIARYSIQNDFGKMKAKEGQIVLDLNNTLQVENRELKVGNRADSISIQPPRKRTILRKIFGK